MSEAEPKRGWRRALRSPHAWVSTTYFAEGFPYALVNSVADVLFLGMGAKVQAIGLTALFHLPWNLKFLWAPVLDRYETKRRFLIGSEVLLLTLTLVLALLGTASSLAMFVLVFVLMAIVAVTHDMAIDGYYMEALDQQGQSTFVGYRAAAYRGAVLLASGPLLIVEGLLGWRAAWLSAAAVVLALLVYHLIWLPRVELPRASLRTWLAPALRRRLLAALLALAVLFAVELRWPWLRPLRDGIVARVADVPFFGALSLEAWIAVVFLGVVAVCIALLGPLRRWLARRDTSYARGFVVLLEQPRIDSALAFIVLFRAGESFLMKMRLPFLKGPGGMDDATFGFINGTLGWSVTLVATLIGGALIGRHGLRRWMWGFILAQNVPNLLYAWAASNDPATLGNVVLGAVVLLEDFGAGLGTAFFIVYLMRCVDPRHKATHMAVLTSIMSLGFTLAGVISGFIADAVGYAWFYTLTFLATVPSMVMMRWVPYLDRTRADELAATAGGSEGGPEVTAPAGPTAGGESAEKTKQA